MKWIAADQIMDRLRDLAGLPVSRQLALMVGLALSVAIGLAVVLWSREPVYRPLYTNLSQVDASEVVSALQERQVAYRIDEHTGTILVPAEGMHETRLALAAMGLPKGGGVGFELLDGQSTFGESQFMESVRYQRVLEGELARTIASLADVQGVRVHLAMPKRSLFVREREKASASVLVNLFPGRTLEPVQVQAIMHLVSSSVPNLERGQVTVVDQTGRLLTPEELSSGLEGSLAQFEHARRIEAAYTRRVEEILTPVLGPGRVRAQVVADLDFTVMEATEELYEPDRPALRSEQVSEQRSTGSPFAGGIPGALSNQPPPGGALDGGAFGGGGGSERSSRDATRNYEIDRTVRHIRAPSGVLKRLSVAVVIDDTVETDKDGNPVGKPLGQDQLDDIEALVKKAVGFDQGRGDTVHIVNAAFQTAEGLITAEPPLWKQPWVWGFAKQAIGALVILLLALAFLRPLMRSAATGGPATQPALTDGSSEAGHAPALAGPDELEPDRVALSQDAQQVVQGGLAAPNSYDVKVARARSLIAEDPRLAADLVKEWLVNER